MVKCLNKKKPQMKLVFSCKCFTTLRKCAFSKEPAFDVKFSLGKCLTTSREFTQANQCFNIFMQHPANELDDDQKYGNI